MNKPDYFTMYQVCLLHSRADRSLRLIVSDSLDDFGLTMMQWLLLATVCKKDRTGMTMSETAEKLDVTLPQVTALMNDLSKKRLVKQKLSPKDRRSRYLMATISGRRLAGKIDRAINSESKKWLKGVPSEQVSNYYRTLEILSSRKS